MFPRLIAVAALAVAIGIGLPIGTAQADPSPTLTEAAALTEATHRRTVRIHFDAAPDEIQRELLTRVDLYDPTIVEVRMDNATSLTPGEIGVGSVRICVFEDGRELHEPILVWEEGRAYAYTVDADASTMSLPVSEIVLIYDFAPAEDGGTNLTVRAFYEPAVSGTGPIIDPVLTGTLRRTFQTAADVFGGEYLGDERP
ncbi:SRPBCC family protein [Aestuariibius insulae]|uniref:SRPBCC family protein n=1 Tax=Aestuariibius insulae TaxID=2058287 RepID=UPI00345EC785